jgi:hypothetical protein
MATCRQCSQPVESERASWATPMCFACLPRLRVLTTRQTLERRIGAGYTDARTIAGYDSLETISAILADAAVTWREAKAFARESGDRELLRRAEHNLDLLAQVWAGRCGL